MGTKIKINLCFLLLSCLVSYKVSAGPILSDSCGDLSLKIHVPPKAGAFYLDKDCKNVYVLPPSKGSVDVVSLMSSANLNRCGEIQIFQSGLRKMAKAMSDASLQEDQMALLALKRHEMIETTMNKMGMISGAKLQMIFSMGLMDSVKRYAELNSHLNLSFHPITLSKANVYFNKAVAKDNELPMVLANGIPLATEGSGNGGESFSGWVDLSLFGACPLKDPFSESLPRNLKARDLAAVIVPNIHYEFNLEGSYSYRVKYKKSGMAQKLKEQSSQGGFFSTRAFNSILEDQRTQSWFELDMKCDEPRVCDRLKMETALQIKQRLMVEILDQVTLTKIGIPLPDGFMKPRTQTGSETAAQGLDSVCKHPYCKVGSLLLNVASSTFGGTTSLDEFINKNDNWVEESVHQTLPVIFSGVQGFSGESAWYQ